MPEFSAAPRDEEYSVLERRVLDMFVLAGDLSTTVDLPQGREEALRGLLDDGLLSTVPSQRPSAPGARQGYVLTSAGRAYVQDRVRATPEASRFGAQWG